MNPHPQHAGSNPVVRPALAPLDGLPGGTPWGRLREEIVSPSALRVCRVEEPRLTVSFAEVLGLAVIGAEFPDDEIRVLDLALIEKAVRVDPPVLVGVADPYTMEFDAIRWQMRATWGLTARAEVSRMPFPQGVWRDEPWRES
jgi:hypothetical protein